MMTLADKGLLGFLKPHIARRVAGNLAPRITNVSLFYLSVYARFQALPAQATGYRDLAES